MDIKLEPSALDFGQSAKMQKEAAILAIIKSAGGKPVRDEELGKGCPDISIMDRAEIINELVSTNKVELGKAKNGSMTYSYKDEILIPSAVSATEEPIYRLIAEGKNMGVLKSEIIAQVDVKKRDLTRMLAEFERKKLVKKVGSPKQKYFLYDVTPDHTVTGGAFYDNDRFDKELVDGITHILKPHLRQIMDAQKNAKTHPSLLFRAASVTPGQIADWLNEKRFVKFLLTETDCRQLLDALVLEGFADRRGDEYHAQLSEKPLVASGLSFTPCGVCPLVDQCRPGGQISPQTCVYLDELLEW